MKSNRSGDYPSSLNRSSSQFEGCWNRMDDSLKTECGYENPCGTDGCNHMSDSESLIRDGRKKRRFPLSDIHPKCTLGDDLILCRISSLLNQKRDTALGAEQEAVKPISPFHLLPVDAGVVLPTILPQTASSVESTSSFNTPVCSLLAQVGVEEVEALDPTNGGASAGQCQFACIASALSLNSDVRLSSKDGFRPDLELRKLALHVIEKNIEMYQYFLVAAGGRTRSRNSEGGIGVDIRSYLRSMSSPSCDGDAVTLQALCDALKITVRVVKPVEAHAYNETIELKRLQTVTGIDIQSFTEEEDDLTTVESTVSSVPEAEETVSTSLYSCYDDAPWSHRVKDTLVSESHSTKKGNYQRKRLFVSSELRPRQLMCVDSRIKDVQDIVRGRLVWLSLIGGEAHYRFLRPMSHSNSVTSPDYRGPTNKCERSLAIQARRQRLFRIRDYCRLDDGYIRYSNPSCNKMKPHCNLCMNDVCEQKDLTSPSSCHHHFCRGCLVEWATHVSNSCPCCGSFFTAIVRSTDGKVLYSLENDQPCATFESSSSSVEDESRCSSSEFFVDSRDSGRKTCNYNVIFAREEVGLCHERGFSLWELEQIKTNFSTFECEDIGVSQLTAANVHRLSVIVSKYMCGSAPPFQRGHLSVAHTQEVECLLSDLSLSIISEEGGEIKKLLGKGFLQLLSALFATKMQKSLELTLLAFIDKFNTHYGDTLLNLDILRNSLGLPKLIFAYLCCAESQDETTVYAKSILEKWAKQFGASSIVRKKTSTQSPKKVVVKPSSSEIIVKIPCKTSAVNKKRKQCTEKDSLSKSQSKQLKSESKAEKKGQLSEMARGPQLCAEPIVKPPIPPVIERAAGKRKVRPVEFTNISRQHWGIRTYN